MHMPLCLSVSIDAPRIDIDAVMTSHKVVRRLVDNRWLHLFRTDPEMNIVEAYWNGRWQAAPAKWDAAEKA